MSRFRKGNSGCKGVEVGEECIAFLTDTAVEKGRVETQDCKDPFGYMTRVRGKPQRAFKERSGRVRFAY